MREYLSLFWVAPAITVLFYLLLVITMATTPFRALGSYASNAYEVMFFIAPVVGIGVFLSLLGVLVLDRSLIKEIKLVPTIALAALCVVSPILFLILGVILSGFLR